MSQHYFINKQIFEDLNFYVSKTNCMNINYSELSKKKEITIQRIKDFINFKNERSFFVNNKVIESKKIKIDKKLFEQVIKEVEEKIGMIIRARPKYLSGINIFGNQGENTEKHYFFNSGRAALKQLLIWFAKEKNLEIIIGIQAFNCTVVLDAALEAGCKVILSDINLKYFSVSVSSVKKMIIEKKVNVLLLTSLSRNTK